MNRRAYIRRTALLAGIAVVLMGINLGFNLANVASSGVQLALGLIAAVLLLAAYLNQLDRDPTLDDRRHRWLLSWPPNESGIQHWQKKRKERLQAIDDPV